MNKKLVDVTIVLDRSGSMAAVMQPTIGGVRRYMADRAEDPADVRISLVQFDDRYEPEFTAVPAGDIPRWNYMPRGCTALLDAIGKTIVATGERLAAMPEKLRPGKVIFVVMTDGYENASTEYHIGRVREMMKEQTDKYGWQFVFLGAGIDAFGIGVNTGFMGGQTMSVGQSVAGITTAFATASANTRAYAGGQHLNMAFTPDQYETADETGGQSNALGKAAVKDKKAKA